MPVTGDEDDQGQPPEAPWHHSTPAVAGASAAALAVIGLVLWAAISLTSSGGPEDAPIEFVPPTYTSTTVKTSKSTTTRTTSSSLPVTTEFGLPGESDTTTTSPSETSGTSTTSETSPTSTTTTTTTTESSSAGYGEYPTTTYRRPRTNVTRTLYPAPGG
ncbi:hypothetical protein A5731_16895 [Mycolicibacterium conceptionense]|uniref:Uncharacterized protein n=3 Tax=Mycolicibacterium TaxID=1866885 RepID=A0A0J8U8C2_9MYCO|nr:hypothetical protein AA982_26270 [Mycolicibacterium senegalense]KMV16635.1 hypothetical protein ACT17_19660 [Mycolicibacterium conceptionense]QZH62418.1 hypothetical protein K1X22_12410 [Mycolicibacterium farcinogenes]KLO52322.1 hypothetical protein ABW05_13150 [Mycolicibacterium senegalense]OBB07747.1 hypothetical protein A5718_16570 [Mycolicibacterium conceptionense]